MELTVSIEEEGSGRVTEETVDADPGDTVQDVLHRLEINPQTVLVERDGQIITTADEIDEDDEALRVLNVISGG